jgi:hypothetical protein
VELTKTEVFECIKCGALSKDQAEIKKCLQRHRKQELKKEKEQAFFEVQNKLHLSMVNNVSSLNENHIASKLIEAAKIVGYTISFESFSKVKFESYYNQNGISVATYGMRGSFIKNGKSEFGGLKVPSTCSHYVSSLLDNRYSAYLGDFIRTIKGLDLGNGGGGNEQFHYDLRLNLSHFPELKENHEEYLSLEKLRQRYVDRTNALTRDYQSSRVPILLHSDIPYQEVKMQLDELNAKMRQLQEEASQVKDRLESRKKSLISKDSPKFVTPDSSFDYDSARLDELKKNLF